MESEMFELFLVGGIFHVGTPVIDPLRAALRSRALRPRIRKPRFSPAVGAVFMALEAAGVQRGSAGWRRLRKFPE